MEITKHTGWGQSQKVETLVTKDDFLRDDVARDNIGTWYIRLVKESSPETHVGYWLTFTDDEARELKGALNHLLKWAKEA